MLFADRIKELGEKKQIVPRQFATALEIDTPMYSKINGVIVRQNEHRLLLLQNCFLLTKQNCLPFGWQTK